MQGTGAGRQGAADADADAFTWFFRAEFPAVLKTVWLGNTLDYVYELEGDTLTIWGGEKGSPAYYQGRFSEDGDTITGAWVYPGGGGYESTATRVKG
jgi:hypothetical protein